MATHANSPPKGRDTGHGSKRLPRRHPPHPGLLFPRAAARLCDVTDAAERPDSLTAHWFLCGAAVPKRRRRRTKPARQTSATEASAGREACSPVRGCSRAVPLRHGLGQQMQPCPGAPPTARPHGPRPRLASRCHLRVRPPRSLPREGTQARSVHSLPGSSGQRPGQTGHWLESCSPPCPEPTARGGQA